MSAVVQGPDQEDADLSRVRAGLPRTSLGLDPEALALYVRAARIGRVMKPDSHERSKAQDGDPPVSFTAGLLALFTGTDSVCSWFRSQSSLLGPRLDAILGEKRLERELRAAGAIQHFAALLVLMRVDVEDLQPIQVVE